MKIGIITYQRAINYGAVFQAYGLKNYLNQLGYDVSVIDYIPDFHKNQYSFIKRPRKSLYINVNQYINPLSFARFINSNLNLKKFKRWEELDDFYDIIICGSDQIWNKFITKGLDINYYLGQFNKVKKISYAASMSDEELPNSISDKNLIKEALSSFRAISVREEFAQKELFDKCKLNSKLVLDPVFLWSFNEILSNVSKIKEPYVLFFSFLKMKINRDAILLAKKALGCKVINVGVEYQKLADANLIGTPPEKWLNLINGASLVMTNSFHMTAFSIKFKKDFLYIPRPNRNNRILDLLVKAGLEKNVFRPDMSVEEFNEAAKNSKADYNLREYIKESKKFLQDSLDA